MKLRLEILHATKDLSKAILLHHIKASVFLQIFIEFENKQCAVKDSVGPLISHAKCPLHMIPAFYMMVTANTSNDLSRANEG